ncbi:general substrate transporter [Thozetella sp. PMI_491]|nr:general substrate transporter [Thozetella sp. PMI_491]
MFSFASFICVLGASLSAVGLGLDVGMISSTLVQPTFLTTFDNPSAPQIGGVVAAFSAGGAIGAYGCAFVADRYGRVKGLLVGAIIAIIGCALQAGAVHIAMLIVGRLINGIGAAQLLAVFPVYASEVAPPSIRGSLGGLQMLMIEMGIFLATAAGYGFGVHFEDTSQWRGPLAVQAIPISLLVVITFFLPESPRWLVSKGKEDEARRILFRLHGASANNTFIEGEFLEIKDQLQAEREAFQPTWMEIARKPSWRRRVILVCGLQVFSQLTGVNCVQYYAASIYQKLGFSTFDSLVLNLIYGAMGLVFGMFWVFAMDRMPRIRILIIGELMMGAALLVQSVLSAVYADQDVVNKNALNAQVAMFFVFNVFFVAVGMLSWLIPPEMCPMAIRAKTNSISVSVNNIAGLVVAEVSPIALAAIGFKFFYVFVAADIIAALVYYFFYPETSKLTLEEIDVLFGDQLVEHVIQEDKDVSKAEVEVSHQEA